MGSSADRDDLDCSGCRGGSDPDALCLSCRREKKEEVVPQEIDSKIAAGSKKSAPFLFALAELQQAAMSVDGSAIAGDDRRSVAIGFWLRRRYEGPFLRDYKARPLALSAYYLLWELTVQLSKGDTYAVLPEVWKVSLFGEKKHGANNWMNAQPDGMWHYEAALWRHIIESSWEERAEDSGCYHLAHAAWNALMLLEMEMRGVVNPDWAIDESAEKSCAYDAEGRTVCSTVAHTESTLDRLVPDWYEQVKDLKARSKSRKSSMKALTEALHEKVDALLGTSVEELTANQKQQAKAVLLLFAADAVEAAASFSGLHVGVDGKRALIGLLHTVRDLRRDARQ